MAQGSAGMVAATLWCGMELVAAIPATHYLFALSWPAATFCAVCGYAMQNFGSGLGELLRMLIPLGLPAWASGGLFTALCCTVTYVAFYVLLIRRIDPAGLASARGLGLAVMVAVCVLVVIGFDVVLSERRLMCERVGVTLTCIADGSTLAQMAPADVYALFGVLLDQAISAVEGASSDDERSVSLTASAGERTVSLDCLLPLS